MTMHNPEHPGRVLKELYLDALELTVTEVAKGLGVSRQALSNIINEHSGITPEMALRLEKAFKTSRQAWLNMQQNYDLWHAIQDADLSNVRVFVSSADA